MVDDLVVLVDEHDRELGVMPKSLVHTDKTTLHRAFSAYVFDDEGRVLVQQRAHQKQTWPGVWSNSCCGHPLPGEDYKAAVARKVKEELGLNVTQIEKVSDYRYRFERNGIQENEFCPVFRCRAEGEVQINPEEVDDWKWVDWDEWMTELRSDPPGANGKWSEWCKEQVLLLDPHRGFE